MRKTVIWIAVVVCFLTGILSATQGTANGVGGKVLSLAGMIFWLSVIQAVVSLIFVFAGPSRLSFTQMMFQGWKWFVFSGVLGVLIVAGISWCIPKIGSLQVFVIVILGQVVGSMFADQIGLFGTEVRPFSILKLVSVLLIIGGSLLLLYAENRQVAADPVPTHNTPM